MISLNQYDYLVSATCMGNHSIQSTCSASTEHLELELTEQLFINKGSMCYAIHKCGCIAITERK